MVGMLTSYTRVTPKFLREHVWGVGMYRARGRSCKNSAKSWCWKVPRHAQSDVGLFYASLWVADEMSILLVQQHPHPLIEEKFHSSALEDEVWAALDGKGCDLSVEDHVSQLIYERWIDFMVELKMTDATATVLWELLAAVEYNLEQLIYMRQQNGILLIEEEAWDRVRRMIMDRIALKRLEKE